MNKLVKTNPTIEAANALKKQDAALYYLLDEFQGKLARNPKSVAKHKYGYDYLPISYVLNSLNQVFMGLVQTKNFKYQVIHDQLCGTIELHYYHPIKKEWMQKEGTGATQIRRRGKDDEGGKYKKGDLVPDGISMDLPRLKSDCIKNAAKDLGKVFGSDLNRDKEDHYRTHYADSIKAQGYIREDIIKQMDSCGNTLELLAIWEDNPQYKHDQELGELFEQRKNELLRAGFGN